MRMTKQEGLPEDLFFLSSSINKNVFGSFICDFLNKQTAMTFGHSYKILTKVYPNLSLPRDNSN